MNARITLSVADCFRVLASSTTSKSPTAADAKDHRQAATAVSMPWGPARSWFLGPIRLLPIDPLFGCYPVFPVAQCLQALT